MLEYIRGKRAKTFFQFFNGLSDLTNFIDLNDNIHKDDLTNFHSVSFRDSSFCALSYDDAKKLKIDDIGKWQEYNNFERLLKCDSGNICMDVSGGSFDVGLVCDGVPECFFVQDDFTPYRPKKVNVYVSLSIPYYISEDRIIFRGKSVLSFCQSLISRGFDVSLLLIENTEIIPRYTGPCKNNENIKKEIRIVKFDNLQAISYADYAFAISSPAMLRRLFFRLMEISHDRYNCSNYGSCRYDLPSDLIDQNENNVYFAYWFPYEEDEALLQLQEQIDKIDLSGFDALDGRLLVFGTVKPY